MTKLVNRAKMTTATTGTGTITLGSAVDGYQTFAAAGVVNSDVVRYVIEDGTEWEIGSGTYSGGTLTRSASESSNAGSPISLSGDAVVFVSATAESFASAATSALSGTNQTIDLSVADIFVSALDVPSVTYSFQTQDMVSQAKVILNPVYVEEFRLDSAVYDEVEFFVGDQDRVPYGLAFKPDGLKMYILGRDTDTLYQYSLSTAWDVSSSSYDNVSFSVTAEDTLPRGIFFKDDGTELYLIGDADDSVYRYTLSTAWDLSTAAYDNVSFSVAAQDTAPRDVFFKPDGTKMFVLDGSDFVYQYSLTTPWDLSTSTYDSVSFNTLNSDANFGVVPQGFYFKDDGSEMFVVESQQDRVYQYDLTAAWDLSTAVYANVFMDIGDTLGINMTPIDIFFGLSGQKLYITGSLQDRVFQVSTSVTSSTTFPESAERPSVTVKAGEKTALDVITTDGGVSYQIVNVQSGIK